jgi:DNA-binding CsgD family transcriptional regulator
MQGGHLAVIANFFKFRDDLRLRNIRWELWPLLLVFPFSFIKGDLRYFDLKIAIAGYQSYELMLLPLGIGWLILAFTPKRLILPLLRIAAVLAVVLLPLNIFMPDGLYRLEIFKTFQFLNGICAAAAFYLFCFELNNIERLFGMIIVQLYYGFLYTIWQAFPALQAAGKTWGGAVAMAACFVVIFAYKKQKHKGLPEKDGEGAVPDPANAQASLTNGQVSSGAAFAIALNVVYYMIMCMINHIDWGKNTLSSMAFGIGAFASIVLIIIFQLLNNRSAMYVWILFLVLSLFGLGILIFDLPETRLLGSFAYGLGDGLGYIIIYYLCAGAIKKSKQLKMFRLYCLVLFIEYSCISGVFSYAFNRFELPDYYLAFGIVLVLCSICFMLMPLMQKKLFEKDWTDGIQLQDIAEYVPLLAETEAINKKDNLNLTDREHEIFAMLLKGVSPKEVAFTLKISNSTVNFHRNNLYRKLGVQSIHKLFAQYSSDSKEKNN